MSHICTYVWCGVSSSAHVPCVHAFIHFCQARKVKNTIQVAFCEPEYSSRHTNTASTTTTNNGIPVLSTSPSKDHPHPILTTSTSTTSATTGTGTGAGTTTGTTVTSTPTTNPVTTATSTLPPSSATLTAAQKELTTNMAALMAGMLGGNANGGSGFPSSKYDDLYISYLESQEAYHAFQIYAPGKYQDMIQTCAHHTLDINRSLFVVGKLARA